MLNRAWLEIDLAALVRNASKLAGHSGAALIPMIKADAYGLGAVPVANALEQLAPLAYGVATVDEGRELRNAGITREIIVFTPLLEPEFPEAASVFLTPTLGFPTAIESWKIYGSPYYLSVDTGMHRAGIPWREVSSLRTVLEANPPKGVFTHFHSPGLDDDSMAAQLARFDRALAQLPSVPAFVHTDSSAAIVRHERSSMSAVRPGIFMYGVGSGETVRLEPEPVVSMHGRIVEIRNVHAGDTVSYDATWTASQPSLVATVPAGYADGYPRNASNRGVSLVRGKIAPIAGRVTMDMTMLDVTGMGAEVGDVATLIGDPGESGAAIDVASVAKLAEMSPYELLTGLRNRIERIYT